MITHSTAEIIVEEYLCGLSPDNYGRYFRQGEMRHSYSVWAANEILDFIDLYPTADPIQVIDEFMRRMRVYAKQGTCSIMFSVAYDVAADVLDIFRAAS